MADAWMISGQMSGFDYILIWAISKSFIKDVFLSSDCQHFTQHSHRVGSACLLATGRTRLETLKCLIQGCTGDPESKKEYVHWKTEIQIQVSSKTWKAFRFTFAEEAWRDSRCTWEVLTGFPWVSLKRDLLLFSSHLAMDEHKLIWTWAQPTDSFQWLPVAAPLYPVQSVDPFEITAILKKMQKTLPPRAAGQHTPAWSCVYHSISVSSNSLSSINTEVLSLALKVPSANIYFLPVIFTFCQLSPWKMTELRSWRVKCSV